jgi:hypothetical protein
LAADLNGLSRATFLFRAWPAGLIRECRALARHDIPGYFMKSVVMRQSHDHEDFIFREDFMHLWDA